MFSSVPDTTALAQLHDQAKREACHLRREAADDFWRGADAVWQRGLMLAQRSATRLRARLARRTNDSATTTKA